MDNILQIFQYGLEGYKTYETKKFAEVSRDKLFQLLTLLVASYFLFRIVRG